MKKKYILIFCILLVNIVALSLSPSVHAQATAYALDIEEDDSFTWEVTELNVHNFEKVFGFEPAFERGDETRITVRDISERTYGWFLNLEFWDYNEDFTEDGEIIDQQSYDSPGDYEDNIFIPTPVNDYLEEAGEDLGSEYVIQGTRVTKRETDFTMIKEYNDQGVLIREEYIDDDDIVMVRVEATFRLIPAASFEAIIGFIGLSIIAVIFVMIKKNTLKFNKSES